MDYLYGSFTGEQIKKTAQQMHNDVTSDDFQYTRFRKAILDCHGYIKAIFEEGLICRP